MVRYAIRNTNCWLIVLLAALGLSNCTKWATDSDLGVRLALGNTYGQCAFERVDASKISLQKFDFLMRERRPVILANFSFVPSLRAQWQRSVFLATHGDSLVGVRRDNAAGDFSLRATINEVVAHWQNSKDFVLDFQHGSDAIVDAFLPEINQSWLGQVFGEAVLKSVTLGAGGVGVPFHAHSETWMLLLHGEKHWFFFEPGAIPKLPTATVDLLGAPVVLPQDVLQALMRLRGPSRPIQCTQRPGEVLYFPSLWEHATINVGDAVGFGLQRGFGNSANMMAYFALLSHQDGLSRLAALASRANRDPGPHTLQPLHAFVHSRFWRAPMTETYLPALLAVYARIGNSSGIAHALQAAADAVERQVDAGSLRLV